MINKREKTFKDIKISEYTCIRFYKGTDEIGLISKSCLTVEDVKGIDKYLENHKLVIINLNEIELEAIKLLCSHWENVRRLVLGMNFFDQFKEGKVEFLECFKNVRDITALPYIGSDTRSIIDFTAFPKLEEVEMNYWPGAESVFKAKSLKKLTIWSYPFKDLSPMKELVNLEFIQLNQPSIRNFKGAPGLKRLKELRIFYAMGLKSYEGIEHFENLQLLLVDKSGRSKDLSPIKKLKKIQVLVIDKAPTLKPLEDHESLESFDMDMVEDKNISVLFKIPKLKEYGVDPVLDKKLPYTEHEMNTYFKYKFKK